MNSAASFSTPPEEEGPCGDWTYHEWAEAFSTNDLARTLPPGHIAVCRVQTGGRGRFNRKWIGEEGGLWASFTVPLSAPEDTAADVHWGHLPLVAGLALFNMLRGMGLDSVRLRWPNDLLAGKSKLAGILVERPAENMAVIGIGINVHEQTFSPDAAQVAGYLDAWTDRPVSRGELAKALLEELDGLETLDGLREYRAACLTLGRTVRLLRPDGTQQAEALGIDRDYGLIVRYGDGREETVRSGEVSVRGL